MGTASTKVQFYVCQTIINGPGTFESVHKSTLTRVNAYTDSGEGYFEHVLLNLTLQAILIRQLLYWECAL
jgi:hypothetical protein